MSYEIHIGRVNESNELFDEDGNVVNPISLSEWKEAIEKVENLRLAIGDSTAVNFSTGEIIRFPNSVGDVEVYFPTESKWIRVYHWYDGVISFNGLPSFDEPNNPVQETARLFAGILNARLVGGDGEFYD